jgi:hypothetical protein
MAIGKAGLRDGSTSTQGGPEPRAATRRPLGAEHGEHGEDRTGVAALLGAAPKAGLNRHDLARPYTERSAGELFPVLRARVRLQRKLRECCKLLLRTGCHPVPTC